MATFGSFEYVKVRGCDAMWQWKEIQELLWQKPVVPTICWILQKAKIGTFLPLDTN